MVVQHNLQAMNANRMLGVTHKTLSGSTEKLSSGYRINRASDDAAGLAISEKMRKQIRGLTQASANAEDGISAVQTAEGALQEVGDMLQRMNELVVQAANGTNSTTDRQYIQDELNQLVTEINRVSETTKFNETYLLKGDDKKETYKKYIVNYAVSYTVNTGSNWGRGGSGNNDGVPYKVNYIGKDNLYIVNADDAFGSNKNMPVTADVKKTGDDVTQYLTSELLDKNGYLSGAYKNEKYGIFRNVDITKIPAQNFKEDKGILYAVNDTGTIDDKVDAYIFDTEVNTIVRIKSGEDLSKYVNYENNGGNLSVRMKDRYRLLEEAKFDYHADGTTHCVTDSHGCSVGNPQGTSLGTLSWPSSARTTAGDILVQKDFKLDESPRQLYDADGKEVSGMALWKYFNDRGKYKGGLYADSQATKSVVDDVTAEYHIGDYITINTEEVAQDLRFNLHVGADSTRTNKITATITSVSAAALEVSKIKDTFIGVVDETGNNATDAIDVIANALQKVSTQRSALGSIQNRLEHTIKNLDNVVENTQRAESAIRDTDMAKEMVKYSNTNILAQAGQSMLAQANQSNQGALSLLR